MENVVEIDASARIIDMKPLLGGILLLDIKDVFPSLPHAFLLHDLKAAWGPSGFLECC